MSLIWGKAYEIHVWGIHEAKYSTEDVKPALPLAKWLLEYTRKALERQRALAPHTANPPTQPWEPRIKEEGIGKWLEY